MTEPLALQIEQVGGVNPWEQSSILTGPPITSTLHAPNKFRLGRQLTPSGYQKTSAPGSQNSQ